MTIPNTYRFFVPPETIDGDIVQLTERALVHQLVRVLRLHAGDQVLLLDGNGSACTVTLTALDREQVTGRVDDRAPAGGEPAVALTLYVALLRPERFEWVLQKGTELGVFAFVPVQWQRSLPGDRVDARKLERWSRIVREAAEQSCRGRVPELTQPCSFATACAAAATSDRAFILWEGEAVGLRGLVRAAEWQAQPVRSVALLSGPEGGITQEELTTAAEHGIMPASLGPRILRAETAPVAAVAALFYELEW